MSRSSACALLGCASITGCYQEVSIDDPDGSPPPWDAAAFRDAGPDAMLDARSDAMLDAREFIPPHGRLVGAFSPAAEAIARLLGRRACRAHLE